MSEPEPLRCSQTSQAADEQLFGTATVAATWLLLEFDGRWGREAFEECDLPPAVRAWLQGQLEALPGARIQMLRQNPRLAPEGIAFYVAQAREADPLLVEFTLERYEDLLALDLSALGRPDDPYRDRRRTEPLYLVCTHGRRDRCCALYGLPVYVEAVEAAGAAVWQSSHLGGHRFAANVVAFPHGLVFGRVEPGGVAEILAGYQRGAIDLSAFRGRACYNQHVQAAEYFLRGATGIDAVEAFRLIEDGPSAPGEWHARFEDRRDGTQHALTLAVETSPFEVLKSCDDDRPVPVTQHRLLHYDALPAPR